MPFSIILFTRKTLRRLYLVESHEKDASKFLTEWYHAQQTKKMLHFFVFSKTERKCLVKLFWAFVASVSWTSLMERINFHPSFNCFFFRLVAHVIKNYFFVLPHFEVIKSDLLFCITRGGDVGKNNKVFFFKTLFSKKNAISSVALHLIYLSFEIISKLFFLLL